MLDFEQGHTTTIYRGSAVDASRYLASTGEHPERALSPILCLATGIHKASGSRSTIQIPLSLLA